MIRSMTGFGKGEAREGRRTCTVQLRGVNSRFLEIALKLPAELWSHEAEARAVLQAGLSRGKVDLIIHEGVDGDAVETPAVDAVRARAWSVSLRGLSEELGLNGGLSIDALLRLPGVLVPVGTASEATDEADVRWGSLRLALGRAVAGLNESRFREGAGLAAELDLLLKDAETRLDAIEKLSLELQESFSARLSKRLAQVLESFGPDDPRIVLEAALAADKADIREELVRFRSHTLEFRRLLGVPEPTGKRLDFLCQELLREANTMGSKSPSSGLTQAVVGLKSVVERLKEQTQNVE